MICEGYAGALASFFQTGDPNAHKLTNVLESGVPEIGSGREWIIETDGFDDQKLSMLPERCEFWRSVTDEVPIQYLVKKWMVSAL